MHLVCLVVAGEGIHDDVDAGAEGKFALAVGTADEGVKWFAIVVDGPSGGIVIGADDDGGDAVSGA